MTAQVGNDPGSSPFRDITTRQSVTFFGGWFFGNEAAAGVGAQAAPTYGVRIRTRLSGPLDLMINGSYVPTQRITINTTLPESTRVGGPIDYNLIIADISIALSITGAKTWHGLAPYLSAGIGMIMPTKTVTDPGGYKAGSGFTFIPAFGVRAKFGSNLHLQVEARDNTIRYEWPRSYFVPTDVQGNPLPPVLSPLFNGQTQTTHNLTLSAGLSYSFNF